MHDSPMPMKTTSGFDSETATAPTDALCTCPSVTGVHVAPPSVVFQSPPPVAPKYPSRGRPFTPVIAIDRPPRSGPILRQANAFKMAVAVAESGGDVCERAAARSNAIAIRKVRTTMVVVRMTRGHARGMGKLLQGWRSLPHPVLTVRSPAREPHQAQALRFSPGTALL